MGLRVTDAVVADHDITNTVTGHAVSRGAPGVVLKQTGVRAAHLPGAFPPDRLGRSVVLDELTDHDISRPGIEEPPPPAGDDPHAAHHHRGDRDPWSSTGTRQ